MKKTIVLNHKSNLNYDEIKNYKSTLESIDNEHIDIILFPSIVYLCMFRKTSINIGAQNFYSELMGNYTGELNLESLKDINVSFTLLNHEERKQYVNETKSLVKDKIKRSLSSGMNTILMIGENKKSNNPFKEIKKELDYFLNNIPSNEIGKLYIMYEPLCLTENESQELDIIRKTIIDIKEYFINKYKLEISVFYAGGVEENNINQILDITDGVGIGQRSTSIKYITRLIDKIS